jgi:hypothetical protein
MSELEVLNLYDKTDKKQIDEFLEAVDSTTRVQIDSKRVVKDTEWIEIMEQTIPYIDNILRNPNRFIVNDEEIVKIELAKKVTVESIKHLSKNTNLIQDIDKKTGDVRPSKILNILKEESYNTYENRLIYSLIQNMKIFIAMRKRRLEEQISGENKNNKSIDYTATSKVKGEMIDVKVELSSKLDGEKNQTQDDVQNILERIDKLEKKIQDISSNEVYKTIDKLQISLVTSPLKKTNVILKNVNFQYAVKLWDYLQANYDDKTSNIEENKDYNDTGDLKKIIDETFLMQYLALSTLEHDATENEEKTEIQEEITEAMVTQMINKMLDMNIDLSGQELKQMIGTKYEVIKYKKMQILQDIQKIFENNIKQYLANVGKEKNKR